MKINRTLLIIFPVLLFAGCRYQAVTDDGISIESLQDKLQVKGKGQFRSLTLGYVADSGDTCTITVYARERIETYSKVWTGYGCIYPEDIHYWHAYKEDIGKLVGIISGNKYLRRYRGRKKTEQAHRCHQSRQDKSRL